MNFLFFSKKGFKTSEKICLERWFNLNHKRKKKILQLENVIYPNYTFFQTEDANADCRIKEEDQNSHIPRKSHLEKNGEISSLDNKGNILWKKQSSLFNEEASQDFYKEPKLRNYKKYCLPMRSNTEVQLFEKNSAKSNCKIFTKNKFPSGFFLIKDLIFLGYYEDKSIEKVPSVWQCQMSLVKSDKMKILNENLPFPNLNTDEMEKASVEWARSLTMFEDPRKEYEQRMKKLPPYFPVTTRRKKRKFKEKKMCKMRKKK